MIGHREILQRLGRRAGIAPDWVDFQGKRHHVPLDSLLALLGALGFAADTEAVARATLRQCRTGRAGLPAALIVDADTDVTVTLPAGFGGAEWILALESGEEYRGRFSGEAAALGLPVKLPEGYHTLAFDRAKFSLIAAPSRCYWPETRQGRDWGLATQLYALRSDRQWGMGDFTDLAALGARVSAAGGLVGISPLHALFPALPDRISPYAPSSRLFLNPLYLDITSVPDFAECPGLQVFTAQSASRLADLAAGSLVDYPAVAALKSRAFALLWQSFRARHLGASPSIRGREFRNFQTEGGVGLARFARFQALQAHLLADHGAAWRDWPPALRDPDDHQVAMFAADHDDEIEQHEYLQWESERQLAQAAAASFKGLYRDLAIGTDPYGADSWGAPSAYITGATIGAPPDLLNGNGQNWGLTSFRPEALPAEGYATFIAVLRANMRNTTGLRIDHVMGLRRLYLVPSGMKATEGAYIRYPFRDLIRILALESRRQNCFIVGEDLGTVPHGFRAATSRAGILSCRVLPFERRGDGRFKPPSAYPHLAAASAGTHDLPPLKAWWLGADLRRRQESGHYPDAAAREADEAARRRDRRHLLAALRRQKLLSRAETARVLPAETRPIFDEALVSAVHRFLALTPSRLVLFQAEDLLGCETMVNLPGTIDQHPNWRQRLPGPVPLPAESARRG